MTFELDDLGKISNKGSLNIIGTKPVYSPYVAIDINGTTMCILDKNLVRFAVNILKAMKSKHLKQTK